MSEQETTPVEESTPQPDASAAETATPELGDAGKRAIAAERRARQEAEKAAAELAVKVKEFEDSQKSESERLAAQLEQARADAAKAQAEALRLRIAAESGLPAELHEFLTGSDEDEVRARAEKLKAATAQAQQRRPQPDPSQGARPGDTGPNQVTEAELARMSPAQIEQARLDGRLADILAGR